VRGGKKEGGDGPKSVDNSFTKVGGGGETIWAITEESPYSHY
jgi:hypothetical protein